MDKNEQIRQAFKKSFNSSMVRLKAVYNGAKKYWLPVVLPR